MFPQQKRAQHRMETDLHDFVLVKLKIIRQVKKVETLLVHDDAEDWSTDHLCESISSNNKSIL
jgi:hypothetical protein